MPLSVWGNQLMQQIQEICVYKGTDRIVQDFQGAKPCTSSDTSCLLVDMSLNINWEDVNLPVSNHHLHNVDIMSVKVEKFMTCVNADCYRKGTPLPC